MTSRVARVALRLRLADRDRDRADLTRRALEHQVIRAALDELERSLHARYGAATIVRIRHLATRWRLDHDTFADPATAIELGRDLAASVMAELEAVPRPHRLRAPAEANLVVFVDEAHADATELADRSEGRVAWFHRLAPEPAASWDAVLARGPTHVTAVERWLGRMERREIVARWIARASAMNAEADRLPIDADSVALAESPLERPPAESMVRMRDAVDRFELAPEESGQVELATVDASFAEPVRSVATAAAGLWYLARLVMELELAEQLWAAGVVEGDFLAHVARAIGGPAADDDPSWRWFGGAFDHEPVLEALPSWAVDELAASGEVSIRRAVPGATVLDTSAFEGVDEVVARAAAALCTLFCSRLGRAPDLAAVRSHVLFPGRLELGDTLRVIMPMEAIDIDLRRAGLDQDPGHLPWLGREVELVFEAATSSSE